VAAVIPHSSTHLWNCSTYFVFAVVSGTHIIADPTLPLGKVVHDGSQMMYANLFWACGHPEVYILVLPCFGVFSEVAATFSGATHDNLHHVEREALRHLEGDRGLHGAVDSGTGRCLFAVRLARHRDRLGTGREPGPLDPKSCYACLMVMQTLARDLRAAASDVPLAGPTPNGGAT